jgi:hypothetical protein
MQRYIQDQLLVHEDVYETSYLLREFHPYSFLSGTVAPFQVGEILLE